MKWDKLRVYVRYGPLYDLHQKKWTNHRNSTLLRRWVEPLLTQPDRNRVSDRHSRRLETTIAFCQMIFLRLSDIFPFGPVEGVQSSLIQPK